MQLRFLMNWVTSGACCPEQSRQPTNLHPSTASAGVAQMRHFPLLLLLLLQLKMIMLLLLLIEAVLEQKKNQGLQHFDPFHRAHSNRWRQPKTRPSVAKNI